MELKRFDFNKRGNCRKHPKYAAKRAPRADCATCREIWRETVLQTIEQRSKLPLVADIAQIPSITHRVINVPLKKVIKKKSKTSRTLNSLWSSQVKFMKLLQVKRNFPQFPVDITEKTGQRQVREIVHDCVHELFEALAELKNYKNHRITNVNEFNRDNFIEEFVDAAKFMFEALILSGVSVEEFIEAFDRKTHVNEERIKGNY